VDRLRPASTFASGPLGLTAQGRLANALDTQLASNQAATAPVRIGISLRTAEGLYCRTFSLGPDAGLACRDPKVWTIRALASTPIEQGGAYRTAGSDLPPAVLQAVQDLSAGPALDAKGEATARDARWLQRSSLDPPH